MSKLLRSQIAVALALMASAIPAHADALGPDSSVCNAGNHAAVLVRVEGFKAHTGKLRVQIYGANPEDFLAKGKWLKRIDLPVTPAGRMDVCVALPAPGNYAIAVRHDVDGNGKSGWSDGGGFSRNPRLSLTSLKPKHSAVVIPVGATPRAIDVVLNYRSGFSIKPIGPAR